MYEYMYGSSSSNDAITPTKRASAGGRRWLGFDESQLRWLFALPKLLPQRQQPNSYWF